MKKLMIVISLISLFLTGCETSVNLDQYIATPKNNTYVSDEIDFYGNIENNSDIIAESVVEKEVIDENMVIHILDVGQADCALIQIEDTNILIDGGNVDDGEDIIAYLNAYQIDTIDIIVATHPHEDHIGGLPEIINQFDAETIYMPYIPEKYTPTTKIYENLLNVLTKKESIHVAMAKRDTIIYSDMNTQLTILSPDEIQSSDLNTYSIVLKLVYGSNSFIFTGDADSDIEENIMQYYEPEFLNVDFLRLGHHGSSTASNNKWLQTLSPEFGIISVGDGNSYGHPHKETITLLKEHDITYYRTDQDGSLIVTTNGVSINIYSNMTGSHSLGNPNWNSSDIQFVNK